MKKEVSAPKVREYEKEITLHDGSVVKMRRPKARDMIATGETTNPIKQEAMIIANLCMMTMEEVEELDDDDFMGLIKARNSFLS